MTQLIVKAVEYRWTVLGAAIVIALAGLYAFYHLPIDAYPDISAQMVQIITTYPGRAPEEVERQVTIPIEIAMRNVPRVEVVRSRTIFGLSVVQLIFEEGTESYWARQRVLERLASVQLPEEAEAELGPLATAYDEIFRYELVSDGGHDLMELRTLNDWVVIPRLLRLPGVAEVSNFGGYAKQFAVTFRPADLERFDLSLGDVIEAVRNNNASGGGSVISRGSMSFVIRGSGSLQNLEQIGNIFVKSIEGYPIYLRDIASISLDHQPPAGIFSKDWRDESVEGILLMRRGENPSRVLERVQKAVEELNTAELPQGVRIVPFYSRQQLVDNTLHTVGHSVAMGITLVVLLLLLFFGRITTALLVALTIPFSFLFALTLMYISGIPIGLLSIGAIDFGIIVDGTIIVAEYIVRRLNEAAERTPSVPVVTTIVDATLEMARLVFFSIIMIIVAYLPLLSLTSIEGLLFRPMALTMVYALLGACLFALVIAPVLAVFMFRQGYREWHNPVLEGVRWIYRRLLHGLLVARWLVLACTICLIALVVARVVPQLGIEFLPYMDEGVIYMRANFPEGTSLQQTSAFGRRFREIALSFSDIQAVTVQAGRNDSGTDPFPPNRLEMMVIPKPQKLWKQFQTKQQMIEALGQQLRAEFPTTRFNFSQPIIDSVVEDTTGTSAKLAIELSGPNPAVLLPLAQRTVEMLRQVRGSVDVNIEQEGPQPQLLIIPDRQRCAYHNIRIEDLTQLINFALGGQPVGRLYEGEKSFNIVARIDRSIIDAPQAVGRIPVHSVDRVPVLLAQVAHIELVDGETLIARENNHRRITVRCDIVGRDEGGFVQEAQKKFAQQIEPDIPPGYHVSWLGMFANLARARQHFQIVMPITVALVFGLLIMTFNSLRTSLVLMLSVPFAFIGGVVALWLRGMNLNVSTGVGFAALFGISVMNGVLIARTITAARQAGRELPTAVVQGACDCLRPVLLTSLLAIFGLLPAALATGLGSDVQRPLATVIVGGLISATILSLFVLPVIYYLYAPPLSPMPSHRPISQL
jgi:cobalt-zinc-cadmium resistance protein CzcA